MEQLSNKQERLNWSMDCERAWKEIKNKLASASIIDYPDYSELLFLHADACKSGFAGILTQIQFDSVSQSKHHVIINATSRTTTKTEKNYTICKLECACVIWIAKKRKHHLYSAPHTTIFTDNYGLQYMQ